MQIKEKSFSEKLQEGLDLTYKRLVEQKIKNQEDFIFGENGRVFRVNPNKITIEVNQ